METTTAKTVWDLYENPPKFSQETCDLAYWSLNYDSKTGTPFQIFLDLIGWSEENIGGNLFRVDFSRVLGFMELDYLGDALKEYATNPHAVHSFIFELFELEAKGN